MRGLPYRRPHSSQAAQQLALDYAAHLEHHLKQLVGKEALPYSDLSWPPPDRWQDEIKTTSRCADRA